MMMRSKVPAKEVTWLPFNPESNIQSVFLFKLSSWNNKVSDDVSQLTSELWEVREARGATESHDT